MNSGNTLLFILATFLLISCATPEHGSIRDDRYMSLDLIPMYGYPREKTEDQKKADEDFFKKVVAVSGTREKASREFSAEGWRARQKGDKANSMRRFNQSWLLNPDYYQPYWGFGALLIAEGKVAESVTFYEKALTLIDEDKEKPRLMTDTARAYSVLGGNLVTTTDKTKSEQFFGKSNALFDEATHLDPQYANAYYAWAFSLYNQANYARAWEMVKKSRSLGRDFDQKFINALAKKMPAPNKDMNQ